jgi:hypothetical protein
MMLFLGDGEGRAARQHSRPEAATEECLGRPEAATEECLGQRSRLVFATRRA